MQFVADTLANSPNSNNRRVAVVEVGTGTSSGGKLDIGPNPTRVNSSYPGQIDFTPVTDDWHSVTANGGVIISFVVPVSVSSGSNPDIKGYVKVFDVAGNLVAYDESTISSSQWTQGTPIGIYWSGKNGQGMRVAPGTYRALVSITAGSAKKKYTGTVGIRR
jgi:hypothetical protein